MTALLHRRPRPAPIALANGRTARFRSIQNIAGPAITGALAAAFIAGLYYLTFEMHWPWFWLKPWWDDGMGGLITSPDWALYRHGERDLMEPAAAVLIALTVVAKRSAWDKRASWRYMITAPVLLLALATGMIAGGIWVIDFGLPRVFGLASPPGHLFQLVGTLVLGALIGRVTHPIWAPVGATINGWLIDRSVDLYIIRREHDPGLSPPLWVRYPLVPLQLRERWAWQRETNTDVTGKDGEDRKPLPRWAAVLLALPVLAVALVTIAGLVAHFWIGSGHTFPVLAP